MPITPVRTELLFTTNGHMVARTDLADVTVSIGIVVTHRGRTLDTEPLVTSDLEARNEMVQALQMIAASLAMQVSPEAALLAEKMLASQEAFTHEQPQGSWGKGGLQ